MIRVYCFMSVDLGNFKTGYLLVYNGIQWSCFILVVVSLLKLLRGGLGKQWNGPTPKQSGNKTTMFCTLKNFYAVERRLVMTEEVIHYVLSFQMVYKQLMRWPPPCSCSVKGWCCWRYHMPCLGWSRAASWPPRCRWDISVFVKLQKELSVLSHKRTYSQFRLS